MPFNNYSTYLARKKSGEQCCCVTGATGPTGPPGALPTGLIWSDYLYWDDQFDPLNPQWRVGSTGLHLGAHAGEFGPQGPGACALGFYAGHTGQGDRAIALGASAAHTDQSDFSVAIGYLAGGSNLGINSIAIGRDATISQAAGASGSVSIGFQAGSIFQESNAVAIGYKAGTGTQKLDAIAIGNNAGNTGQTQYSIAIGSLAGALQQGVGGFPVGNSIAIGKEAGSSNQKTGAIAIGEESGRTNQGFNSIAIGREAGSTGGATGFIAIGDRAGRLVIGENTVAIGRNAVAGASGIEKNCIYINSTGNNTLGGLVKSNTVVLAGGTGPGSLPSAFDNMGTWAAKAFYVSPIRENYTSTSPPNNGVSDAVNVLKYSLRNHEVVYEEYVNPTENFVFGISMSSPTERNPAGDILNPVIQNWTNEYVSTLPDPLNNDFATQGVWDGALDWPQSVGATNYWIVPGHDVITGTYKAGGGGAGPSGEINHYRCGVNWIFSYPTGPFYYNSPKGLGVSYKGPYRIRAATISLNETGAAYLPTSQGGPVGSPAPQFSLNGWSVNLVLMIFTYCKCDNNGEPIITPGKVVYIPIQRPAVAFGDYMPEQEPNGQPWTGGGWKAANFEGGYCKCYAFRAYEPPDFPKGGEELEVGCETSEEDMEFIGIKIYPLYASTTNPGHSPGGTPYFLKPEAGNPLQAVNWYTYSRSISVTLHGTADKIISSQSPVTS